MAERATATGDLGLVQAFVNTADLEPGTDQLGHPNTLSDWLVAKGLMARTRAADQADLKHAIALREAIRGAIGANSGGIVYPVDIGTLNGAVSASRLIPRFGPDGKARLEAHADGVEGALGRIVAAVFAAMNEDGWTRLKLCASSTCRWAFYDQSRNHSSRWCRMASCGNRQKAKRFRERAKSGA
ncbi:MAG TPA: CGNR zinc finger domain-containing protein [Candidatus Acidoferrum sp.]|jgi:predicted RNA-binding Zn ribbon-like protein|nr:CGNR zinc finger domain-containing protein [Candidatus Acidoferrum sp.]